MPRNCADSAWSSSSSRWPPTDPAPSGSTRHSKRRSRIVGTNEQPLAADQWDDHRTLFEQSKLPIFADESCITEADVARCGRHFHGVNIKLVKCGGLTPARRMIDHAKQLGLKVMVGCMTESTVGISAIAQLLPLLDYVDMDGAALLAEDVATGVHLEKGICHFPNRNGTGVELLSK